MMRIIILALLLCAASAADAATRYAKASAGLTTGTCTVPSDPTNGECTPARMLALCVAGDTCIFKDGTYTDLNTGTVDNRSVSILFNSADGTASNRIIIRSETRHGAIIQPPNGGRACVVRSDYVTLRGFKFDGRSTNEGACQIYGPSAGNQAVGVTIEDNWFLNIGSGGLTAQRAQSFTYRYNQIDGTALDDGECCGSPFYLAAEANGFGVTTGLIYGNYSENTTNNVLDYKNGTIGVNAHHNLWEDHRNCTIAGRAGCGGANTQGANDGIVHTTGSGSGNTFANNIVRASPNTAAAGVLNLEGPTIAVTNNVFRDITGVTSFMARNTGAAGTTATGNTFCGINITNTSGFTNFAGTNSVDAASGTCDTEVARIIAEIAVRPVIATAEVGLIGANKVRITLTNQSLATIDGAAIYGDSDLISSVTTALFTCSATASRICVDGTPATISSAAVVGTNIIELTLAVAIENGEVVTLNGSLGAFVSTGGIGGAWISDLASSAAFTNRAVTNNVEGAAPSHVLDQKTFQFYNVRTSGGLLTKLPHAAAALNTNIRTVPGGSVILGIQIDGTVADAPSMGVLPYYQQHGAGGYAAVPGSFGADNIRIGTTQTGADVPSAGEAISTCLTGALTVVNGLQVNSANAVPTFDLTQDDCIVNRWAIEFDTDVTAGDYYEIRLYNQTTDALNTYTVTPRIDIISDRAGGGT
jgi:hypothetical protein